MSDPIMELVDAHARALHRYYTDASNERAEQEAKGGRAAIEREVAALRERAERAELEVKRLDTNRIHTCWEECPRIECAQGRRIRELERGRDALISAGKAVRRCCIPLTEYWEDARPALDAITGQPEALERWMRGKS